MTHVLDIPIDVLLSERVYGNGPIFSEIRGV